jgi:hypothetical protein
MNIAIIDRMMIMVENGCDEIGYDIDQNAEYIALCQMVTDIQVKEKVPTVAEKQWASETLEMFFDALGMSYGRTLFQLLDEFYGVK